nr:hypothetical protein [Tanacetum cinerariifolium]
GGNISRSWVLGGSNTLRRPASHKFPPRELPEG